MPESQANPTGSDEPSKVPFGKWDSFSWEEFPEWEGTKAIIFRSLDGSYVTAGWIKAHVHGGETFTLKVGDCVYFTKGQMVDFECSEDYANVSVFFGTEPITLV
ncbi:hypothetical protein PDIG_17990 [Penicillium digitatum PHI26]|uniref:(S)-ureidoglycine aminohydrolase cupin domain-containing protein n=2 Tax=Penicillium digitatum TaxID=36651 RepID=K9GQI0_PEND2|nr:hypothetical protein PDIP_55840 [Penicillium digitatum Pd1]EKV11544.1 hypothetical protein PDIP_55840 [Penicillium digitatum Pd1]EKV16883.1 hypothetical protein PDIG_17990 [Penicillium digitatum PHI26]